MAVVKNTFTTTLDTITSATYKITGLTSETSSTSVSYMSPQITENFLTAIYQTLLDAGYSDANMNTTDYSITVLGFKFFALCRTYSSSNFRSYPLIYTHGLSSNLYGTSDASAYYVNNSSTYYDLSYKIIVRGDENCVGIWYGGYNYPNSEVPLIFIAKTKNLITKEDSYCFCGRWYNNSSNYYVYFRSASNIYTNTSMAINSGTGYPVTTFYEYTGGNSASKIVCEPILGRSGEYYIYSLIKAYNDIHVQGNYYKIGEDIYYCYGYKEGSATSYSGAFLLMKVS